MARFTTQERSLGNWILAALFALAGAYFAVRTAGLFNAEGFTLRSAISALAVLGFVSLVWRTTRAATRPEGPPAA